MAEPDDLGLRERDQRGEDPGGVAFDARLRGEAGKSLKGLEILRSTVGIAAVVNRVDAEHDRGGPPGLGKGKSQREEDRVAGRHIGRGDTGGHFGFAAALGDRRGGIDQGAAAEGGEVDLEHDVVGDAQGRGHLAGRGEFDRVPLAVGDREGRERVALGFRPGGGGGGIEAT